jgi:hypothetical protein
MAGFDFTESSSPLPWAWAKPAMMVSSASLPLVQREKTTTSFDASICRLTIAALSANALSVKRGDLPIDGRYVYRGAAEAPPAQLPQFVVDGVTHGCQVTVGADHRCLPFCRSGQSQPVKIPWGWIGAR